MNRELELELWKKLSKRNPKGPKEHQQLRYSLSRQHERTYMTEETYEITLLWHYTTPHTRHPDDVRYPLDMWDDMP